MVLKRLPKGTSKGFLLFVHLDKPLVDGTRKKLSYSVRLLAILLWSEQHIGAGFWGEEVWEKAASVALWKLPAQEHAQGGGTQQCTGRA